MLDICGKKDAMSYNGREVMETAATRAGWTVQTMQYQPDPNVEWVTYEYGYVDSVLIAWTPQNTAPYVAINGKKIKGMGALIEARRYMEGNR